MSRTRDDSRRDDDDDTSPARTQAVVQKGEPTGGKESDEPGQQLLTSSAVACTATADNDKGDDDDDDDDEQTTRKALDDFHIRSTPPSPASKSSGPAVPSALTEAADSTDTAADAPATARRQSSPSQSSKPVKQHSSVSGAQPPPPHPHNRLHRENFLVFTRILFKCLSDHPSPEVRIEAKRTIMDCTKRNRMGDPGYHPLIDAIEARLRHVIGDIHWKKALEYLDHYMTYRRIGGASVLTKDGNNTDPPVSCR